MGRGAAQSVRRVPRADRRRAGSAHRSRARSSRPSARRCARSATRSGAAPKILVGKPGLDGHSNGAEQIALRARDAGFEVVYEGIRVTPAQIARSAADEGVHLVGLRILSGAHNELVPEVLERLRAAGQAKHPRRGRRDHPRGRRARAPRPRGVARVYTPKDFALGTSWTTSWSWCVAPMDSAEAPETDEAIEALIASLVPGVRAGERVAVARALNIVEDRRPSARARIAALLRALGGGRAEGHRIGLTGPPGVGKSTLVSTLAATLRARGQTVGVLAVDPSSPRSGGALLGDRARIDTDPDDQGLFVRSLATAGELGGLARAAPAAVMVLAAAYDRVLVETVGVGQSETDVEHVVDTVVFVVQPGSGDALQFLKAGIMEIPDVLVVNKADMGETAARDAGRAGRRAAGGPQHRVAGRSARRRVRRGPRERRPPGGHRPPRRRHRRTPESAARQRRPARAPDPGSGRMGGP